MSEQRKAVIKNADMSEEMQQDAVDIASQALAKYNIEKVSSPPWASRFSLVITHGGQLIRVFYDEMIEVWRKFGASRGFAKCRHYVLVLTTYSSLIFSFHLLQDVAAYIKKEFDKKHNPTW
jgi:hypothetical protein